MSETIPFTPIEEMTHHLERTFEPWNMQGELESSATVDIDRLREAALTAMEYHPMATARRRESSLADFRYSWELQDDPEPPEIIEVDSSEADLRTVRNDLYGRRFDLTEEAPFRIVVYRGGGIDGGDHLLQSTSHVAGDGAGTLRFAQAVWTAYRGEEPTRDSVTFRESRSFLQEIGVNRIADRVEGMESVVRRLREAVLSPTDIATDGASDEPGWGYARRYLGPELTARLVGNRPEGVTVNDVLLSALHLAIDEWNDDHGKVSGKLSVMMPVNLRPKDWFYQVMAMYSTFESVRTRRGDRRDPADTVERVTTQTSRIKERDRGVALYKALELLPEGTPIALKQQLPDLLRGPGARLTDSALLTNLGNIPAYPSLGEDTEERAVFTPPAWSGTPVGFGVATFDGELQLFCRYLLSQFDRHAAERFVDTYVAWIERLVDRLPELSID